VENDMLKTGAQVCIQEAACSIHDYTKRLSTHFT